MASQHVSTRSYRIFKTPTRPQTLAAGEVYIPPIGKFPNHFGYPGEKDFLILIAEDLNLQNEEPSIRYDVLEQVPIPGARPHHNDNNLFQPG